MVVWCWVWECHIRRILIIIKSWINHRSILNMRVLGISIIFEQFSYPNCPWITVWFYHVWPLGSHARLLAWWHAMMTQRPRRAQTMTPQALGGHLRLCPRSCAILVQETTCDCPGSLRWCLPWRAKMHLAHNNWACQMFMFVVAGIVFHACYKCVMAVGQGPLQPWLSRFKSHDQLLVQLLVCEVNCPWLLVSQSTTISLRICL